MPVSAGHTRRTKQAFGKRRASSLQKSNAERGTLMRPPRRSSPKAHRAATRRPTAVKELEPERGGNLLPGALASRPPRRRQPNTQAPAGAESARLRPQARVPSAARRDERHARHDTDVFRGRLPRGCAHHTRQTSQMRPQDLTRAGRSQQRKSPRRTHARKGALSGAGSLLKG